MKSDNAYTENMQNFVTDDAGTQNLSTVMVSQNAIQVKVKRRHYNGEENPQNCTLLPLGFRHPAGGPNHGHGNRQHAQKIGKDRACGSIDTPTDRQTDRRTEWHRQKCSSQYFATAFAGEVNINM